MIHMLHKNRTMVKKSTFRGTVVFILIGRVLMNGLHCTFIYFGSTWTLFTESFFINSLLTIGDLGKNRPLWVELSYIGLYAEFYGAKKGFFRVGNNQRRAIFFIASSCGTCTEKFNF